MDTDKARQPKPLRNHEKTCAGSPAQLLPERLAQQRKTEEGQSDHCQGALAHSTGPSPRSPLQKLTSHQSPCHMWILVKENAPWEPLCSARKGKTSNFNASSQTNTSYCFSNSHVVLGGLLLQDTIAGRGSAHPGDRCSQAWPASPPRVLTHLPRSGCRLSTRHLSCSSPRCILSSSSRCSMMRADFIFTKYS